MLPHADLDNYKLQVELLQEKLKRSEENRERLEKKLEYSIHKKAEQEKIVRAKQRQKYQEFVNELEKRNERNRQLKQMIERIDHQTSALSARSERLRMMKMQYEMYFAKLVQSQTMRTIQETTSNQTTATRPTPIPILLPTVASTQQQQKSSIIATLPIKNNEQDPTTPAAKGTSTLTATSTPSAIYQCDASGNLIAVGNVTRPASYTLSPRNSQTVSEVTSCNTITPSAVPPTLTAGTQHWTLAMATPTPSGMLLTTTPTIGVIPTTPTTIAAPDFITIPAYEYMQYPLDCLPRMKPLLQPKPIPKPKPNTPLYSDESDDLLQPIATKTKIKHHFNTNNENEMDNGYTYPYTEENNVRLDSDIGSLNQLDLPTRQLDNDKNESTQESTKIFRKGKVNEHQQQQQQYLQKPKQLLSNVSTTSLASSLTLDKLPKTMTMTEHGSTPIDERNNDADDGKKPQLPTYFDERSKDINIIGCEDKGAFAETQRNDEEKITPNYDAIGALPATIISNDNGNAFDAKSRREIDKMVLPKQEQNPQKQPMTQSWHTTVEGVATLPQDEDSAKNNVGLTAGFLEYAENNVKNTKFVGGNSAVPSNIIPITTKVSIEKIENEIYGELVNPPISEADTNLARNAAQGLLKELDTQKHQSENQQIVLNDNDNDSTQTTYYDGNEQYKNSTDYKQPNNESDDPTYAPIEGITAAEVHTQSTEEVTYANDQNASNNYVQYSNEPQEEYSNIDYGNYDTTYDPNSYPGYTYDATTGEYTPDPAQQYNTENDGLTETYGNHIGYEQQKYQTPQQSQEYDYATNYDQQEMNSSNATFAESTIPTPPPEEPDTQKAAPTLNVEPSTTPIARNNKPASILSSTEKHIIANDGPKKKKRVNFVDSSETDESSSIKKQNVPTTSAGSESDFDFSSTSDKSSASGGV